MSRAASLDGARPFLWSIQSLFRSRRTRISDMRIDPIFDGQSGLQRGSPGLTGHHGLLSAEHGIAEILQFPTGAPGDPP
jgi:hypothetical protein